MKYAKSIIIVIVLLIAIKLSVDYFTYGAFAVKEIQKEYQGEIINIYSSRKNVAPTFIEIQTESEIINTSVSRHVIKYSSIGDSVFKRKDENIITIRKKLRQEDSFYLIQIDEKLRNHRNFPEAWKNKWLKPLKTKK